MWASLLCRALCCMLENHPFISTAGSSATGALILGSVAPPESPSRGYSLAKRCLQSTQQEEEVPVLLGQVREILKIN